MSDLNKLKASILEDGVIDADEVAEISKVIYADGSIDEEEADFMFDLNDAVSGKENDSSWDDLFVKAICDYLLEDEKSPGELDADEANWLYAKIAGDGQLDQLEIRLLKELKSKVTNPQDFPASFNNWIGQ